MDLNCFSIGSANYNKISEVLISELNGLKTQFSVIHLIVGTWHFLPQINKHCGYAAYDRFVRILGVSVVCGQDTELVEERKAFTPVLPSLRGLTGPHFQLGVRATRCSA